MGPFASGRRTRVGDQADVAVLRAELGGQTAGEIGGRRTEWHRELAQQTRTFLLTAGTWVSGVGLAFTAAQFS